MARTSTLVTSLQLALVVSMTMETGFCLHCYECDSSTDEACVSNPRESKECQKSTFQNALENLGIISGSQKDDGILKDQNACLKYVGINTSTNKKIVVRKCATLIDNCDTPTLSILFKTMGFEKTSCDTCFKDNCNSSSIPSAELFLLVPLIVYRIFFS